nr:MAG TPA: hypothetical protein [Caudoviricetes sp.]
MCIQFVIIDKFFILSSRSFLHFHRYVNSYLV